MVQGVTRPESSIAILQETEDPAIVTLVPDVLGLYVVELRVIDDSDLQSEPVQVIIIAVNNAPIAEAGPDQAVVVLGTSVELDGIQSWDPDGDNVVYSWTITQKPIGSTATISDPTSVSPSFVADVQGDYVISLVVTDSFGAISVDSVTVSFNNIPPVADPGGNQSVVAGDTVSLSGSGSCDANEDELNYLWTLVSSPQGSLAELAGPAAVEASFIADVSGEYRVRLVVNDGLVDSQPAEMTVQAISNQDAAAITLN
jgi:chitinase